MLIFLNIVSKTSHLFGIMFRNWLWQTWTKFNMKGKSLFNPSIVEHTRFNKKRWGLKFRRPGNGCSQKYEFNKWEKITFFLVYHKVPGALMVLIVKLWVGNRVNLEEEKTATRSSLATWPIKGRGQKKWLLGSKTINYQCTRQCFEFQSPLYTQLYLLIQFSVY